jgi:hypothetical protein
MVLRQSFYGSGGSAEKSADKYPKHSQTIRDPIRVMVPKTLIAKAIRLVIRANGTVVMALVKKMIYADLLTQL